MTKNSSIILASTQFDADFNEFFDSIVERSQFTPEQQTALGETLKASIEKTDKVGNLLAYMEGHAEMLRKREKQIADQREHFENFVSLAKSSLHQQMTDWGVNRVEGNEWIFAIRKNPPSVEISDEALIPAEFVRYTPSIDKQAIKDALSDGKEVPGAKLNHNSRLEIK